MKKSIVLFFFCCISCGCSAQAYIIENNKAEKTLETSSYYTKNRRLTEILDSISKSRTNVYEMYYIIYVEEINNGVAILISHTDCADDFITNNCKNVWVNNSTLWGTIHVNNTHFFLISKIRTPLMDEVFVRCSTKVLFPFVGDVMPGIYMVFEDKVLRLFYKDGNLKTW